jgi:anti-sigma factor RsiW
MHHPEFERLLVRSADGLIDTAERETLDRHLATCDSCREALAAQTLVRASLQARPPIDASAAFYARVRSSLRSPESWIDSLDFRRWTWRLAPIAAALVIAVAAFAGFNPQTESGSPIAEISAASTAIDQPVSSALWSSSFSDDSVISLMLRANADDALSRHVSENNKQQ